MSIPHFLRSTRADWVVFVIAIILVGRQALSYAFWGIVDIAVRLDIWPPDFIAFDAYGYYSQTTLLHEAVFVAACISFMAALIALILRDRLALPLLVFCLVPGIADWVMMTSIPQMANDLSGYIHLIGHLVAICALAYLHRRGFLR